MRQHSFIAFALFVVLEVVMMAITSSSIFTTLIDDHRGNRLTRRLAQNS